MKFLLIMLLLSGTSVAEEKINSAIPLESLPPSVQKALKEVRDSKKETAKVVLISEDGKTYTITKVTK